MILTGDLHANATNELDFLKPDYLRNKFGNKCENTIIFILGDGGFLWYNDLYSDVNGTLINTLNSYMYELNSKCIVIPGNHENYKRIYNLPKMYFDESLYKGDFREISHYIMYTERYSEYTFEGKSILCLGGASSLDKTLRKRGETWFENETYSIEDKDRILHLIKSNKNKYELVLSHTCPDLILRQIYGQDGLWYRDENSEFFTKLMNYISPKTWYFGHLHPEKIKDAYNYGNFNNLKLADTEFKCLFKDIQESL